MRTRLTPFPYALIYAAVTLLLYQRALMGYVLEQIDPGTRDGLAVLALIEGLQITLSVLAMTVIGLVSPWAMKITGAALMIVNAAAQHYMLTYGVVLDPTMIGNILNTNPGEAGGLIHPQVLVTGVLWGVLPALVMLALPVRRGRLLRTLGALVVVLALTAGGVYAGAGVWLWFDQHNSRVGPRILPWGYVGNALRYAGEWQRRNRPAHPLPDPTLEPMHGPRTLVVLVIGEAARRDHLAYFGYDRPTDPFTRDLGLVAFPDGRSCATYTIGSVACILSPQGDAAEVDDPYENLPAYLARAGVPVLVRENNTGLPPIPNVPVVTGFDLAAQCEGGCPEGTHDAILLRGLSEALEAQGGDRAFALLHFNGSHGPEYYRKYPPAFEEFTPTCQTTLINDCAPQSLVNAYDNSIRYTDWVLSQLIAQLDALPDTQVLLLYLSDHGQSLGEGGVYLHGLPNALAPEAQRMIPFLAWMDDDFARAHGLDPARLGRPIPDPQDRIFSTVLGALGIASPAYRADRDVLRPGDGTR